MTKKEYYQNFSKELREYRIKNNYTQRYIAYKFGVTQQTISAYEKGIKVPKISTFIKINKIIKNIH